MISSESKQTLGGKLYSLEGPNDSEKGHNPLDDPQREQGDDDESSIHDDVLSNSRNLRGKQRLESGKASGILTMNRCYILAVGEKKPWSV